MIAEQIGQVFRGPMATAMRAGEAEGMSLIVSQIDGLERPIPHATHRPQASLGPSTQGVWSHHLRSRGHEESAG
jgi:hypothetical protein